MHENPPQQEPLPVVLSVGPLRFLEAACSISSSPDPFCVALPRPVRQRRRSLVIRSRPSELRARRVRSRVSLGTTALVDVWGLPMGRLTPAEIYLQWKRQNAAVGCIFARLMAAKPAQFGQRLEVLNGADPQQLATGIDGLTGQFIADSAVAALAILLPEVGQTATLVDIVLALQAYPGWRVTKTALPNTPGGPMIAFGLTRDVPLAGGGVVPSETLVLGTFDGFPATRRSPVPAIEIFVGVAPSIDPKTRAPTTKANLAHVNVQPIAQSVFDNMWEQSKAKRLSSLGGIDDARAKAKVAFVVPQALAVTRGWWP